jgi:hypothetical protein
MLTTLQRSHERLAVSHLSPNPLKTTHHSINKGYTQLRSLISGRLSPTLLRKLTKAGPVSKSLEICTITESHAHPALRHWLTPSYAFKQHAARLDVEFAQAGVNKRQLYRGWPNASVFLTRRVRRFSTKILPETTHKATYSFSREDLIFQSDVTRSKNAENSKQSLLVDNPRYRNDFGLWLELLAFRKRTHGSEGIRDIWYGMQYRNVTIPTVGYHADTLWSIFVGERSLLSAVVAHALKRRSVSKEDYWTPLYPYILKIYLPHDPETAYLWHRNIQKHVVVDYSALKQVADSIQLTPKVLSTLRLIYFDVGLSLASKLSRQGQHRAAASWWHALNRHVPSERPKLSPNLTMQSSNSSSFQPPSNTKTFSLENLFKQHTSNFTDRIHPVEKENKSLLLEFARDVTSKELSDRFTARLFATTALSPSAAINIVWMLGAQSLGPLSLQELVLRCESIGEVVERFNEIIATELTVRKTAFSSAVAWFAHHGDEESLRGLVHSDQHPDTYNDKDLLLRLIAHNIHKRQWVEAHRMAQIYLIAHLSSSNPRAEAYNVIFPLVCKLRDLDLIWQFYQEMRIKGILLTTESLDAVWECLRRRRLGFRPVGHRGSPSYDDLALVTTIFQNAAESGLVIRPGRWRELIKRFGMTGSMDKLEKFVVWLVNHFNTKSAGKQSTLAYFEASTSPSLTAWTPWTEADPSSEQADWTLRQIFRPITLRAIIAWGFRHGLDMPNTDRGPWHQNRWIRGIALLDTLRGLGLYVPNDVVYKELRIRCLMLYGQFGTPERLWGRRARKNIKISMNELIRTVESMWGTTFPPIQIAQGSHWWRSQERRRKWWALRRDRKKSKSNT